MTIIIANIMLYGIFAFVTWEFNPGLWEEVARFIFSLMSFGVSSFTSLAILKLY
jgi:hypothetical protein